MRERKVKPGKKEKKSGGVGAKKVGLYILPKWDVGGGQKGNEK